MTTASAAPPIMSTTSAMSSIISEDQPAARTISTVEVELPSSPAAITASEAAASVTPPPPLVLPPTASPPPSPRTCSPTCVGAPELILALTAAAADGFAARGRQAKRRRASSVDSCDVTDGPSAPMTAATGDRCGSGIGDGVDAPPPSPARAPQTPPPSPCSPEVKRQRLTTRGRLGQGLGLSTAWRVFEATTPTVETSRDVYGRLRDLGTCPFAS